ELRLEHVLEERVESAARLPAKIRSGSRRIGAERGGFPRPQEGGVDDDGGPAARRNAGRPVGQVGRRAIPGEGETGQPEGAIDELPDGVELSGRQDVIA